MIIYLCRGKLNLGVCEAAEMAPWESVSTSLAEDPLLIPRTHSGRLTATCNSSFRGPKLSGLHGQCIHMYTCT